MSELISGNTYITTDNAIKKIKEESFQQGIEKALNTICNMAEEYCDNCKSDCYGCQLSSVLDFADEIRSKKNE